jgi:sec-independent protein translocase protein TatA
MHNIIPNLQAISMPGTTEWIIILIVAVLIFGRRLPEVARNLGRSVSDFKKGMQEASDIKDDITKEAKNAVDEVKDDIKRSLPNNKA